jgi:Flp pilus assembly protein TadD
MSLYSAGRFTEALATAETALPGDPENAALLNLAAVCAISIGLVQQAERYWRKALSLRPDYSDAHNNLGALLKNARHFEEAESHFRQALAQKPHYPEAHNNLGMLLKELKRYEEAEASYRQSIAQKPDDAKVHYHLGNLLKETGRFQEAETSYRQALALQPDYPDTHNNLGNLLREVQRFEEAEAHLRQALAQNPNYPAALSNLGNLFKELKRYEEAEASYRQALAQKPENAKGHYNLGNLLREVSRIEEAEASYRQALALAPEHFDAHNNLGVLLLEARRFHEAASCFCLARELKPNNASVYNNLGSLFKETERFEEAEENYRQALSLDPTDHTAHNNLGILLMEREHDHEAEVCFRHALVLKPDYPDAHNNLGSLLKELKQYGEAETSYRRALTLRFHYPDAHNNLGSLLKELERFEEAEASYRLALSQQPDHADAAFNLSYLLLYLGRFEEGWRYYESRYSPQKKEQKVVAPNLSFPQWQGEPLLGKSLLIWPEQGFGDEIQFCRYAPLLKQLQPERITLICKPPLQPLFRTLEGIDAVFTPEDISQLPVHDYWTFLLSLPLHARNPPDHIPAHLPYLSALPQRIALWAPRLPNAKTRVGLAWKGNGSHKNDGQRSLPHLSILAKLWTVHDMAFISLQKGQGENEAKSPPEAQPLVNLGTDIRDFADTAAIIAQLDLVICVDTSVAHLAGAMGKPCWVMLPFVGTDWRWQRERLDSPWYPGVMRLFRQKSEGDWIFVVEEIAAELNALARKPSSRSPGEPTISGDRVRFLEKLDRLSPSDLKMIEALVERLIND